MPTRRILLVVLGIMVPALALAQEKSKGGAANKHCPAAGWVTCEQWCDTWRGGSQVCKHTHEASCMKKYGSLKACVRDGPPKVN
jgi:hypothetical protein